MKSVAVVGAGSAGLVVVKELKQAGLEPTAFESRGTIGGRWACDAEATGVWKELCLNLSRRWMEYSDFPWQPIKKHTDKEYAGIFAHHEELRDYLVAYAKHFGLLPHIYLKTHVVSATRDDHGGWTVVTQQVDDREKRMTQKFDGLVICSGIYSKKHHPLADTTLKEYTGVLEHSEQFKSVNDYKGKNVLVIGSVISGPEISSVLASQGECKKVSNSTRHVPYHMSKISPINNKPFDDLMFIRFPAWLGRILPDSMLLPGLKSTLVGSFHQLEKGENCYSDPDHDVSAAGIATSVKYVDKVMDGSLQVVPGIKSVKDKIVTFMDGSTGEYDVIICGTGYSPVFDFLPKTLQDMLVYKAAGGKNEIQLYRDCIVPDIENLAFCGVMTIIGPLTAVSEMQARLIAGIFSGKVKRPPLDRMKKLAEFERESREFSSFKQYKNGVVLMEEIGDDLGVTPSLFKALWDPKKYLFAPCYPVQYRMNPAVDGEQTAKKAKERFEYFLANPQTADFS